MKKEFIVQRQGKDFVLYAGLLDQAHREGLKRISTELLQAPAADNGQLAIVRAEVETEKGVFCGLGDASPQNVGRMIAPHSIRMAETRAKARALRDAINVGVTALVELSDEADEPEEGAAPPEPRRTQQRAAQRQASDRSALTVVPSEPGDEDMAATPQQKRTLLRLKASLGQPEEMPADLSYRAAALQITELAQQYNAQVRPARH